MMDDVCSYRETAIVTRQTGDPVVVMSLDDYNGMCETVHLMRSPKNASRLKKSMNQIKSGRALNKELNGDEITE